jgi:hypothetical protein
MLKTVLIGPDGKRAGVGEGLQTELASPAHIQFADSPSIDAFGRARVSNPETLFDSQFQYDENDLWWESVTASGGSATHLPDQSSIRLRVDTTADASCIRQTYAYHRYQPGKSQLVLMTFLFGATSANVTKRLGCYDAENGISLRQDENGKVYIGLRSNVTGSVIDADMEQSAWNLDRMDGDGPSGVALDWSKVQILCVDMEWLGVGRVRVGFVVDGLIYYAHQFVHSNIIATTYMTTANLPLRYEISASGSAGATTDLIQICSMVASEGGFSVDRGLVSTVTSGATGVSVATAGTGILAIRPATTRNSITNRSQMIVERVSLYATVQDILWLLVINPTITASWTAWSQTGSAAEYSRSIILWLLVINPTITASWTAWSQTGSAAEYSRSISSIGTGNGNHVLAGYVPASQQRGETTDAETLSRLPLTLDYAGTAQRAAALWGFSLHASLAATVWASITWRELG